MDGCHYLALVSFTHHILPLPSGPLSHRHPSACLKTQARISSPSSKRPPCHPPGCPCRSWRTRMRNRPRLRPEENQGPEAAGLSRPRSSHTLLDRRLSETVRSGGGFYRQRINGRRRCVVEVTEIERSKFLSSASHASPPLSQWFVIPIDILIPTGSQLPNPSRGCRGASFREDTGQYVTETNCSLWLLPLSRKTLFGSWPVPNPLRAVATICGTALFHGSRVVVTF